MTPKEGDHFARRYRIVRVIGRGAMGIVMEAIHETLETRVAIKILRPESTDERATKRFLREAKLASRLRSEHVVRVLDVDRTEDDTPYIVMELLDGRDLAAELEARTTIPYAESVRWMLGVCEAMKEAHREGIVHRDLKLSNVFLCKDGRIKVLDFGVAALGASEADSSTVTTVAGTIRYMAPEQLLGENPHPGSDVWAIGIMLYRLVTGRFPYEAPTAAAQMLAIMEGCAPVATVAPEAPEGLARLIQSATGRTLEERCPSIEVLSRDLEALVIDDHGTAPPAPIVPPPASMPPRPSRRRLALSATLVATVGGLLVALVRPRDVPPPPAPVTTPTIAAPESSASASVATVEITPPTPPPPKTAKATKPAPKPSAVSPGDGFPTHL